MSGKSLLIVLAIFLLLANGLLLVYLGVIKLGAGARVQDACELRGIITDEKGAFITGATLTLSGDGHGYSTETDNQGRFRFIGLKPGAYALTVTATGFAKQVQPVELAGPRSIALAIKLKVFIAEQMDVKSNAPAISAEPDKNLSSIVLTGKDLQTLPGSPGGMLEALRLMACPSCRPEEVALYVNGFRYDSSGKSRRLPPKEAIEMIRIAANPFSSEYQEPGQGRIEIVTKPGSDGFHSDVSVRYNDESLN